MDKPGDSLNRKDFARADELDKRVEKTWIRKTRYIVRVNDIEQPLADDIGDEETVILIVTEPIEVFDFLFFDQSLEVASEGISRRSWHSKRLKRRF
jgi:hypothetical protein